MNVWINELIRRRRFWVVEKRFYLHDLFARCDDTVNNKQVKFCVLKYFFWRELSNQKNRQKTLEMLSPALLICVVLFYETHIGKSLRSRGFLV